MWFMTGPKTDSTTQVSLSKSKNNRMSLLNQVDHLERGDFLKFLLNLPELGKVQSSNFLGLFNLALVGLDLLLEVINQVLHALVVLLVLVRLESKLLDAALALAQVLLGVGVPAGLVVEVGLELANAAFQ